MICYSLDVDVDVDIDVDIVVHVNVGGPGPNEFCPDHGNLQHRPYLIPMVSPHRKWDKFSIMRMKMKMILVMQISTSWESFPQINPSYHDEQTMSLVVSVQSLTATLCLPMPPPTSSPSSWPTSASTWPSTSP